MDTDVHFKETYETINKVKEKYPQLNIVMKKPALTLEQQATQHGDELWKSNPNKCCDIRKIKPLHEALSGKRLGYQAYVVSNHQHVNKQTF